ncbi:hypothetical protein GCM10017600_61910 [Streptosporangium carneum]|uniref:Uncharacterized protein n=1 Tax=Streptosporangium carneum TaxID=47481 RepID=A0A9W6I673_9ACTN|nr:hypothetical protein GCM10017600_61910 [Streptosporangium carneum]
MAARAYQNAARVAINPEPLEGFVRGEKKKMLHKGDKKPRRKSQTKATPRQEHADNYANSAKSG